MRHESLNNDSINPHEYIFGVNYLNAYALIVTQNKNKPPQHYNNINNNNKKLNET